MPINNPPLRDLAGDDSEWTSPWAVWFTQVLSAIFGWRKTYTATKTHDFGNIVAQSQDTTTVSVIGARSGDAVLVRPTTAVNGIILDGTVTALDTVTIRAVNYSSGAIDPASQVYRVIVFQQ
jgi:hypothetical protein